MENKNYELTNPQKSIWYTEQFYKGTAINNIGGIVSIKQKVNFNILKKAIYECIKNNDAFRLKLFYNDNGEIIQTISDFEEFDIKTTNLKSEKDISILSQELMNKPFTLVNSNLFKIELFKLPNGQGGLIIIAHHLICDAMSLSISTNKLINYYSALIKKETFQDVNTSYEDFIKNEKEYLKSDKFKCDKNYWNSIFESVPEIGSIPSVLSENQSSCKANRKTYIIPKEKLLLINEFCNNNKISAFNFFMGIYAIYIGKSSNLNEFVLGTPILNRTNFIEKNTLGMFISTVPLKFSIDKNQSFSDFCKKIATDSFGMLRHQKYPYQYLLDDIRKKNSNQPNLYDILISYQNARTNRNSSDINYDVSWTFNNNVADSMQIHLFDLNDEGILNISYDYRINKYDEKDIDSIHNRILYMIDSILNNNSIFISDIEIITPEEKELILNEFNNTDCNFNIKNSIIEYIEDVAAKHPNNIAIESNNAKITYKELVAKINKLSNYLLEKYDIPENNNIGIFTTRTIDTIVGILAILKINCTYVPIDVEYPLERISYMIETSKIQYLLSENIEHFNKISNITNIEKISIHYLDYELKNPYLERHYNYNNNSNLYIIFTSGSTGKPKGVTISHKNMINLMLFEKNKTNILKKANNKILQFATMSFDVSYQEIYSSLLFGNTIVLIDDSSRKDMNKLSNYIANKKINILFIPPAYLKLLVENPEIRTILISHLDHIITAGEALIITEGIKELINNGITIHNHYGPAETHVATTYIITKNNTSTNPPIGKPISNSNIHILDNSLKLCPINTIGQIAISGDCVGNGYWNNDELTKEKFQTNPYNQKRMYLTGDLGFFDYTGNVHFIGRSDFQIKLNGFRVELNEIDQVMLKNPNIKSSVTIIHEENGKKYIITYYIEKHPTTNDELVNYLNSILPNYMLPKKLIKMSSFPINTNGKIDKKNLPIVSLSDLEEKFIKPKTDTELKLAEIWKNLFNTNKIGANYNFFNIGGDSLLAIKLSSIILSSFNIDIKVGEIFENPTLEKLAALIDSKNTLEYDKLVKAPQKDYYNLSSAQRRIYYASKMSGENSCLYNMPAAIIFDKEPDINKLNESLNILIKRHQILRTYFEIIDNNIYQKVLDNYTINIDYLTINNKNIDEIINSFVLPFDLSKAPLFRVKLIKAKNKSILLFDMHHIISDGLSISILTKELCDLYNGKTLEPINFDYIDYAEWEYNQLQNNSFRNSKDFWLNQFKNNIPVLNMPTDFSRPAIKSYEGKKIYITISEKLTEKINKLSKKLDISNYMLLLAVYYVLLSKYTGQEEIVIGTPTLGRNKEELLDILGVFINSLPLKCHIDSSMKFDEFLKAVKANSIQALEHLDYPFDELVNDLKISRDTSRNPLFDTMFIYQNDGYTPVEFNDLKSQFYIPDIKISKFDLSLEVIPIYNKYNLVFEYSTSLFKENTIKMFAEHFINILEVILNNASITISNINMLSKVEQSKILSEFNNTKAKYNQKQTITKMIELQCKKTPNNIAVTFENKSITYKEFNEKANQLARCINSQGIGKGNIVGIMLPRSLETLISIFAVLKSGACYIPIDPNYPKNRINYMLENSNADLLLCFENNVGFSKTINVSLNNTEIYQGDASNLKNVNLPTDPSYIIYTSGSTGTPKGVMLNHLALTNLTNSLNKTVEFLKKPKKNMAIASITTISFDIFIFETLICLQKGLKIVLSNENEQVTASLLDELIAKNNVQAIQMTPSRMQIFIDNKEQMPHLSNLKYVILAGEALPDKLLKEILKLGNITVYNGYGPSETTVFSTFTNVTNFSKVNIGSPISNTQIYILDKDLNICPIGVIGEIYIAGDGVGLGYINNKEITKERFITNKFNTKTLYYKTGDLAKYLPNGQIEYIGRIDNQIKIRGLRIELNEIENWILKFPNIDNCIVTAKTDAKNRTFLVAYLTISERISIPNLRSYLSMNVPKYMIPSYFVILNSFPYLPNGKINKNALPSPTSMNVNENREIIKPKNELENKILNIFEKILNVSPISTKDNFFDLGGDSLLAMTLQIELMKISNNITYSDIFTNSTIESLAKKIEISINSDLSNYTHEDFSDITHILDRTLTKYEKLDKTNIGNILISGTTGYLGAHILNSFLSNNPDKKVYCLIRPEPGLTLEKKLLNKLQFYFGDKYNNSIGTNIIIVNSDISEQNLGISEEEANELNNNIDIVINSAAMVTHYGNPALFKKVNIDGVKNLIDFCTKYNKKLYQVSTLSISGNTYATSGYTIQNFDKEITFKENNFFINQSLENVYIKSKFEAEKLVLEAINTGLNAYILRVGNLMPRLSDGKFQTNFKDNAYMNRLLTFMKLKMIPEKLLNSYAEFTPVDCCAEAIIKLIEHPTLDNRIFHLYNHNHVPINKLLKIINEIQNVDVLPEEEFKKKIDEIIKLSNSNEILNGIIGDFDSNRNLIYETNIKLNSDFTINYLEKTGFKWPNINRKYLIRIIKNLANKED